MLENSHSSTTKWILPPIICHLKICHIFQQKNFFYICMCFRKVVDILE